MKTYMLWHGGSNYACPSVDDDIEEFRSLAAAKREFDRRQFDPYYPCCSDAEAQIFFYDPRGETDPYPDMLLRIDEEGRVREGTT